MKTIKIITLLLVFVNALRAQCSFDAVITGDTILCPGVSGVLQTQEFDSYQWYKRAWPNGTLTAIPGATEQYLDVEESDILNYFSVEVTLDSCTEFSPEVLLDGYVFLLPVVMHTGDFTFDPNLQVFKICEGDTMFLTLQLPYDTLITWYRDGSPVPGETGATLAITEPGAYTVEGAPSLCPGFLMPLGLTLHVTVVNCTSTVKPELPEDDFRFFPNPAADFIRLEINDLHRITALELLDAGGRIVQVFEPSKLNARYLPLDLIPNGVYWLRVQSDAGSVVKKVIKVHR